MKSQRIIQKLFAALDLRGMYQENAMIFQR